MASLPRVLLCWDGGTWLLSLCADRNASCKSHDRATKQGNPKQEFYTLLSPIFSIDFKGSNSAWNWKEADRNLRGKVAACLVSLLSLSPPPRLALPSLHSPLGQPHTLNTPLCIL